jgi:hypothetical protein
MSMLHSDTAILFLPLILIAGGYGFYNMAMPAYEVLRWRRLEHRDAVNPPGS